MKRTSLFAAFGAAVLLGAPGASAQTIAATSEASQVARRPLAAADKVSLALFVDDATVGGQCRDYLAPVAAKLSASFNKNGFAVVRVEDFLDLAERAESGAAPRTMLTQHTIGNAQERLDDATILQLARDTGADCYLHASLSGVEKREIASGIYDFVLDLSLSAYGTARGDGTYGDTITATARATAAQLAKNGSWAMNELVKKAVDAAAASFARGLTKLDIRAGRPAKVFFSCNVPATILVDGFAMGTTDAEIEMESGMHTVALARPFCETNAFRARFVDGQKYDLPLYLNREGIARLRDKCAWIIAHRDAVNESSARWIVFTNDLAKSNLAFDRAIENGDRVLATALSNGTKLVDAAIADRGRARDLQEKKIDSGTAIGLVRAEADAARVAAETAAYTNVMDGIATEHRNSFERQDIRKLESVTTVSQGVDAVEHEMKGSSVNPSK